MAIARYWSRQMQGFLECVDGKGVGSGNAAGASCVFFLHPLAARDALNGTLGQFGESIKAQRASRRDRNLTASPSRTQVRYSG